MTLAQTFAEELKAWRGRLEWTQERAASHLDVPLRTYQEWEQGRRDPAQIGPIRKLIRQSPSF